MRLIHLQVVRVADVLRRMDIGDLDEQRQHPSEKQRPGHENARTLFELKNQATLDQKARSNNETERVIPRVMRYAVSIRTHPDKSLGR